MTLKKCETRRLRLMRPWDLWQEFLRFEEQQQVVEGVFDRMISHFLGKMPPELRACIIAGVPIEAVPDQHAGQTYWVLRTSIPVAFARDKFGNIERVA